MASTKIRAQLEAEIAELQRLQMESNREATFGGWTPEAQAAHRERADRLECLVRELGAVDGTR